MKSFVLASLVSFAICSSLVAADRPVLDVWPGKVPGETKDIGAESFREPNDKEKPGVQRLSNVSKPTLTVYQAVKEKQNGAAVIVCPGGGYNILAWDLEGTEVAEWLNSIGVTAFVLKYRVPKRENYPNHEAPLMDGQRSLSLVRSRASDYGLDPRRIGMLGFSAGGHLTAATCIRHEQRQYDKLDAIDEVSCRPDFGVVIYPGLIVDKDSKLRPELTPSEKTPPMFFAQAIDDRVNPQNAIVLALALKAINVPAELHIYDAGGHGFGLRKSEFPCHTWPARAAEWMDHRGLLSQREPTKPKS